MNSRLFSVVEGKAAVSHRYQWAFERSRAPCDCVFYCNEIAKPQLKLKCHWQVRLHVHDSVAMRMGKKTTVFCILFSHFQWPMTIQWLIILIEWKAIFFLFLHFIKKQFVFILFLVDYHRNRSHSSTVHRSMKNWHTN